MALTEDVTIKGVGGAAVFSPDGRYRYLLHRQLVVEKDERESERVLWVMLNPSLAGAHDDDPTIRKCMGFTKRWGFDALTVVNLFNAITPYPKELPDLDDPVGPEADDYIVRAAEHANRIVLAWGKPPFLGLASNRVGRVRFLLREFTDLPFYCLGKTAEGYPRHPSRIAYKTKLERTT